MYKNSNTLFFGSNTFFSLRVLDHLAESSHIPGAIVIPEFPAFEFRQTDRLLAQLDTPNELKRRAKSHNIEYFFAPERQADKLINQLSGRDIDFILVACWPYKLSAQVCRRANRAAMNLHPSLLPEYRGANPVEDQITRKERNLGVSLHLLSDKFDSGDIIKKAKFDRPKNPDREAIEQQAAELGARLFIESCQEYGSPKWSPQPQESGRASNFKPISSGN
ncbi:MAG: formyltransferase family protein [Gammaproteobacteria bacterium]|nr:formyltransferase family protein [Gammaproteobacteria bacterium]